MKPAVHPHTILTIKWAAMTPGTTREPFIFSFLNKNKKVIITINNHVAATLGPNDNCQLGQSGKCQSSGAILIQTGNCQTGPKVQLPYWALSCSESSVSMCNY